MLLLKQNCLGWSITIYTALSRLESQLLIYAWSNSVIWAAKNFKCCLVMLEPRAALSDVWTGKVTFGATSRFRSLFKGKWGITVSGVCWSRDSNASPLRGWRYERDIAFLRLLFQSEKYRESLSWIRMTKTAWQDARRSGKEDAGHSLFLGRCLFGFYGEHNSKIRKGSCRDVTWMGLVVTWRLIRDWSYLRTFRIRPVHIDLYTIF